MPPQQNQVNIEQLMQLVQDGGPRAADGDSSVPFLYRAVQQPPRITGLDQIDAILGMIGPTIGTHVFGMQDPQMMPRMGPGIDPWSAYYAARVTTPLYQTAREQQVWQLGGQVGGTLGQIGTTMGIPEMIGMTPQDFQMSMTNAGQNQVGRALTEAMVNMPAVQRVMGGNPLAAQDYMFGRRHALGVIPGMPAHPMDIEAQTEIARHTAEMNRELMYAIRPMGLTQDAYFTQGLRDEDIAKLTVQMAQRGADVVGPGGEVIPQGMRGVDVDPRAKVAAVGEMNRVIRSVMDVVGSDDFDEAMRTLDTLTQKQWPRVNSQALLQSFREIQASTALLAGQGIPINNRTMVQMVGEAQEKLQASIGIGEEERAIGMTGGGYGQMPAATLLAETAAAVSGATNMPIQQAMRQQIALTQIGMASPMGRDIQHMAYLRSQNFISEEQFARFEEAVATSDTGRVKTMAEQVYEEAYGEAAIGRQMTDDPIVRQLMQGYTDAGTARRAMGMLMAGQGREVAQRMSEATQQQMRLSTRQIEQLTGMTARLDPEEASRIQREATLAVLRERNAPEWAAEQVQDVYQRAIERGETPQRAMRQVQHYLGGARFADWREDIQTAQRTALTRAQAERAVPVSEAEREEQEEMAAMQAGLRDVLRGGADQETRREIREVRKLQRQAARAERKGETSRATELKAEALRRGQGILGELEGPQREAAEAEGRYAVEDLRRARGVLDSQHETLDRVERGRRMSMERFERGGVMQMSGGDILTESQQIRGGLEALAVAGEEFGPRLETVAAAEEAMALVEGAGSLSEREKERLMWAIEAGPGTKEFEQELKSQRDVVQQMQRVTMATGSQRKFGHVLPALQAVARAGETLQFVQQEKGPLGEEMQATAEEMAPYRFNTYAGKMIEQLAVGQFDPMKSLGLYEGAPGSQMVEAQELPMGAAETAERFPMIPGGQLATMEKRQGDKVRDDEQGAKGYPPISLTGTLHVLDKSGATFGRVDNLRRK